MEINARPTPLLTPKFFLQPPSGLRAVAPMVLYIPKIQRVESQRPMSRLRFPKYQALLWPEMLPPLFAARDAGFLCLQGKKLHSWGTAPSGPLEQSAHHIPTPLAWINTCARFHLSASPLHALFIFLSLKHRPQIIHSDDTWRETSFLQPLWHVTSLPFS